jgi:hypothetical protein
METMKVSNATNGQWAMALDKVFNFRMKDGEFPMDEKLLDDAGRAMKKITKSL